MNINATILALNEKGVLNTYRTPDGQDSSKNQTTIIKSTI